jgi:hypothetical protein
VKRVSINVKNPYQLINLIFLGIILLVFIYSLIYSPDRNNYPIKSNYTLLTGNQSISSGLSHGFSCMIRGRIQEARQYNPLSSTLFFFFIIQFTMRVIVFFYLVFVKNDEAKFAAPIDAIVSTGLFILFFYPFLEDLFRY